MADLHLARLTGEDGFERLVAVKVIHEHLSRQPEFVKMFIDEARLASRISHPNVALTLDLGRVGQKHFIAMEYVNGESLTALLRRGRPPISYAARIVCDAAAGLHAAHELRGLDGELLGVVHRDVSPQNILISYDGAVKVVDFGVARVKGSLHSTSNEFKGKFEYMAPEQCTNPRGVDRRTDVFALGIILYEATTWTRLFKGETDAETVEKVLREPFLPPSSIVPDYPAELERIVLHALQRDPEERYATAGEMHEDLERFIVATGERATPASVGQLMREIFAVQIEEKESLVKSQPRGLGSVRTEAPTISERTDIPGLRRRPTAALVVAVLVLLAAGAVAVLYLRPFPWVPAWLSKSASGSAAGSAVASGGGVTPSSLPAASQPASQPRSTITLAASAIPASATITLDGKPMRNPFEIERPAGSGTATLEFSAPGYRTQRLSVPLSRSGSFTVGLVPEGKRPIRPGPVRKKGKKGGGGVDYLENPYQ
jgi:serine/threonine-protein kinase